MSAEFRNGNVTVTLNDALEDIARRAVEEALPGVLGRMEAEISILRDQAWFEWPRKTGRSADALEVVVSFTDNGADVRIRNPVRYAIWVRPAAWYGSTTAYSRLVQRPMRKLHKRLSADLGPMILSLLRGDIAAGVARADVGAIRRDIASGR